jgi:hypothetical protein
MFKAKVQLLFVIYLYSLNYEWNLLLHIPGILPVQMLLVTYTYLADVIAGVAKCLCS